MTSLIDGYERDDLIQRIATAIAADKQHTPVSLAKAALEALERAGILGSRTEEGA